MCKPTKDLKICTCGDNKELELLQEKLWQLIKSVRNEPLIIGQAKVAYYIDPTQSYILDRLNSQETFDFEYTPVVRDKLIIKWNEDKEFRFEYSGKH